MGALLDTVMAKDDELVWAVCAGDTYSEAAYGKPRDIWPEVLASIEAANDEAISAIATCLVEHMLQVDFAFFAAGIRSELNRGNQQMAACMTLCAKLGESALPENSTIFDQLKADAYKIGRSSYRPR